MKVHPAISDERFGMIVGDICEYCIAENFRWCKILQKCVKTHSNNFFTFFFFFRKSNVGHSDHTLTVMATPYM